MSARHVARVLGAGFAGGVVLACVFIAAVIAADDIDRAATEGDA